MKPIPTEAPTRMKCCSVGVTYSLMWWRTQSGQKRLFCSTQLWPVRLWKKLDGRAAVSRPLLMRSLRRRVLDGARRRRVEELGDQLDREDPGDPPLRVDD